MGLAVGQEVTQTANTLYSLKAKNGKPDWNDLDKIVGDWEPKLFVLGNPLNMDGSKSKIKEHSDRFSNLIRERYKVPVELVDERLTTKEATSRMKLKEIISNKKYLNRHSLSAKIILESWFREKK
ncbi:uncharacterized protein METZ01_LOCUS299219 [marine metagenome]|uniref:YqgF/RNase H-like domain-containing protein n=1 Tax=marine metagenome TaxID=408172 RepID=A0A382ME88_9ZZZZ